MRIIIIILSFICIYNCKAQINKEQDAQSSSHELIIAGDNGLTGLATTALGTFIVISNFSTQSPRSADAIKAVGYSCIGVGIFFSVKSFYHIRKAGKLLANNNRNNEQTRLNIALGPMGLKLNWRF
jgi:hypothetical protein